MTLKKLTRSIKSENGLHEKKEKEKKQQQQQQQQSGGGGVGGGLICLEVFVQRVAE